MEVVVYGSPDNNFTSYVEMAVKFFARELMPKKVRTKCNVTVVFNTRLNENHGLVLVDAYDHKDRPRGFVVEVDSRIGAKEILQTLAHEMVHVKQYAMGDTDESLSHWLGVELDPDAYDYWDYPWEIEAFGRETGLLFKLNEKYKLWKVFEEFIDPDSGEEEELPIIWKK